LKTNYSKILIAAFLFKLIFASPVLSQDTVKIMTYNLLNYSGSIVKDQSFRKVLNYSKPDILVVEEIISQTAVNNLLSNVLNYYSPGLYSAGTFINGFDTDNAIFFKTEDFTFLYNFAIPTTLRNISLFGLVHNASGDTIQLFAVHLKAGNTQSDQTQRLSEVNVLRNFTNTLSFNSEFIVLGDFNIYSSLEACYQRLLQVDSGTDGHFIDPYNLPGTWNQSGYTSYHSQSTRTRSLNDSGATGGLDDRFDMILNSRAITEEGRIKYIPGSLKPFGNDGFHYNDSINRRPNLAVPDSIADALYYGSDHLPVVALYKFDKNTVSVSSSQLSVPGKILLHQNYPNPFNPVTMLEYEIHKTGNVELKVFDVTGKEVQVLANGTKTPGKHKAEFNGYDYPSGIYFYALFVDGKAEDSRMMMLLK